MSRIDRLLIQAALLTLGAVSTSVLALPDDRTQNINLQASHFDRQEGKITWSGNARLQQGSLVIEADQIVVHYTEDDRFTKATAIGQPAHFQQQPDLQSGVISAKAHTIIYDSVANAISLSGEARLEQDGVEVNGHEIRYDINQDQFYAEGNDQTDQPIQMTIPPAVLEQ